MSATRGSRRALEPVLPRDPQDRLPRARRDVRPAVQRARDGRDRDAERSAMSRSWHGRGTADRVRRPAPPSPHCSGRFLAGAVRARGTSSYRRSRPRPARARPPIVGRSAESSRRVSQMLLGPAPRQIDAHSEALVGVQRVDERRAAPAAVERVHPRGLSGRRAGDRVAAHRPVLALRDDHAAQEPTMARGRSHAPRTTRDRSGDLWWIRYSVRPLGAIESKPNSPFSTIVLLDRGACPSRHRNVLFERSPL